MSESVILGDDVILVTPLSLPGYVVVVLPSEIVALIVPFGICWNPVGVVTSLTYQ